MALGIRLHTLWRLRLGLALSLALALVAAVWSVEKISLTPPSLISRDLEMATASAHVVVDTPKSALIDLRQDTYSIGGLQNRTVLLGNVMASTDVRRRIEQRAGVPAGVLRVQPPLTREMTEPAADSENARHPGDLLKSTDQYRLSLQADPTVPMLDILAQAPTAKGAAGLANAAVEELKLYLQRLAAAQQTPPADQIHLLVLGSAEGVVVNKGVDKQVAILVLILTLGVGCASVIFISRVRAGWREAALAERTASA